LTIMKKPTPFITVSSNVVWSCPWYGVRRDEIILPDGGTAVYNTITKSAAVWIVPVMGDGRIAMLYTYRHTVDDWCWEIPAGGVKPDQSLEEAALAELREETGGRPQTLAYVQQFYTANGICNEIGHIFLATGVELGLPQHEPVEIIEIHPLPIVEVLNMAHAGKITDATSALAILLCEPQLRQMA
jgi:8-oxo-dGTP pyrophosphatase MutT (NUDIX family)